MLQKIFIPAIAVALFLATSLANAQIENASTTAQKDQLVRTERVAKFKFEKGNITQRPDRNGVVKYTYRNGLLATVSYPNGVKGLYKYKTNGNLDTITFSNGVVHTAKYGEHGIETIESNTGKSLRFTSNEFVLQKGRLLGSKETDRFAQARGASLPNAPVTSVEYKTALNQKMVSNDQWETQGFSCEIWPDGTQVCTDTETGGGDDGGGGGVGCGGPCYNPGEEPGGGGGGGEPGGGGGGGGEVLVPGTGPMDNPRQAACTAAAYRAWSITDAWCRSRYPDVTRRGWCTTDNINLYAEELRYCATLQ